MVDREEYLNQLVEILQLAARQQGGKRSLINAASQETGITFSKSTSYRNLIVSLQKEGAEKEFCQAIFNANSFDEVVSRYVISQGLSLLSSREIFELADYLSDDRRTWKYDKSSATKAIMALAETVPLGEINECISTLMSGGRIELLSRQNRKWVIGPLGITQAIEYRKQGQVWSLKRLFEEELPSKLLDDFARKAQWLPATISLSSQASEQCRKQQLIQSVLTYGTTSNILSTFNELIADGVLNLKTIRTYDWNIVGTPCGVFTKQYNGVNRLAQLIVNECAKEQLKVQLSQKGYFSTDVRLGAIEMCLRENPVSILEEFFGWADLMRIAQHLSLVRVQNIPKAQLAEVVAISLGFQLPVPVEGLTEFLERVEKSLISMTEPTHSIEELNGIMAGIYRTVEAILKDMLHFYVGFLWPESLTNEEPGERRETFNHFCKKRFDIDKVDGVDGLTLGELVHLFYKLNHIIKQDPNLQNKLNGEFQRKFVIPAKMLSTLEDSLKARKYLAHDKGQTSKSNNVIVKEFELALTKIKEFAYKLKQEGFYPHAIRVKREVTDEFDRRYVEAVDEDGKSWLIHSSDYLWPNESYFMHSVTTPIAVDPYLSVRYLK